MAVVASGESGERGVPTSEAAASMICDDERCRWSMRPATAPDRNPCGLLPASLGGAAAAPLRSPLLRR